MTELSFYLWASDALGSVKTLSATFVFILTGGVVLALIAAFLASDLEADERFLEWLRNQSRKIAALWLALLFFAVTVPGEETRRNILLVEIGSSLAELDQAQKIGGEVGELAKETIAMLRKIVREKTETTE